MADEHKVQTGSKEQSIQPGTGRPLEGSAGAGGAAANEQAGATNQALIKQGSVEAEASTISEEATKHLQALTRIEQGYATHKPVPVISIRNLTKTYIMGKKTRVDALSGVSLEVYPGEYVAIMGPSGSGKTTFMNLLGCLDRPTSGEYWLAGRLVSRLSSDELAAIRNRMLGFVFQGFNLLGRATAVSNVALPLVYAGLPKRERERRARKVLTLVGLGKRLNHKPTELSGGQQQRVAIARALVNGPAVLLADEPTGNLDSRTSVEIMGVLQALNDQGLTIVVVTHDANVAQCAKRQVQFLDGRLIRDEPILNRRSAIAEWEALENSPSVESKTQIKEEGK
jgi:putative ABC transport system ATP-binding protein